jgi:hypothetical protein
MSASHLSVRDIPHAIHERPGPRLCVVFRNMVIFYGEELLAPRATPKLEGHPLSALRDCLFNVFAATLYIRRPLVHPQTEDASCSGDRDPLNIGQVEGPCECGKEPSGSIKRGEFLD